MNGGVANQMAHSEFSEGGLAVPKVDQLRDMLELSCCFPN